MNRSQRIAAIDWLRGLAVLVMIQTHALALLATPLRGTPPFRFLVQMDGLVAPSFIFAAGFSIALVQVRSAASGSRLARLKKTARRLGEVFFVAYLGSYMFLPIFREPKFLLRLEILHCIAVSLVIALSLLALLAPRPTLAAGVMLSLGVLAFGSAPLLENVTGFASHFVTYKGGSPFPLLPWAGYVFLGSFLGALTAARGPVALPWALLGLGLAGEAASLLAGPITKLYPPHNFWITSPSNHGGRLALVCLIALVLYGCERFVPALSKNLAIRVLAFFGTSSLSAYFFHESLLYYRVRGLCFFTVWGAKCSWGEYAAATLLLIVCTAVLMVLNEYVQKNWRAALSALLRRGPKGAPVPP